MPCPGRPFPAPRRLVVTLLARGTEPWAPRIAPLPSRARSGARLLRSPHTAGGRDPGAGAAPGPAGPPHARLSPLALSRSL